MKKISRILSFLLLTVGFYFVFSSEVQASSGDTLIVAQGADATSLDPQDSNDQPSSRVSVQIYDRLVDQSNDTSIQPSLAESWEQPDNLTTIFKLRKGVKFHNGEELKSSDVKFTLERMMTSARVKHIVEAISSVEVPDDYTVIVRTEKPFGALLNHLAHTAASIVNEKAVKETGDTYGQNPVGTGPYKFVSWRSGDRITLEAFPEYFKGVADIKNLIIRNISENSVRAIGLETGEVQIAYDLDPLDLIRVREDDRFEVLQAPSYSMTYIGFNTQKAPYNNIKFRQAIASALDLDIIVEAVFEGGADVANTLIAPSVFGHNNNLKPWERDIEKAKALLAEAGITGTVNAKMWVNDNKIRQDIAIILQDQLREIGVNLSIETIEWGAFLDGTERGDHEMFIMGWGTVTGDGDYGLFPVLHSSTHGGGGNRSFYTNPQVNELLENARNSVDQAQRQASYTQVQEIIHEELPSIPVAFTTNNVGLANNVEGFILSPAGHHRIYGVKFKN